LRFDIWSRRQFGTLQNTNERSILRQANATLFFTYINILSSNIRVISFYSRHDHKKGKEDL
jgi:hypothetical protein